jgi:hypothetical protein
MFMSVTPHTNSLHDVDTHGPSRGLYVFFFCTHTPQTWSASDKMAARADRLAGALWGLYAGDAIAMPVHWYYDVG